MFQKIFLVLALTATTFETATTGETIPDVARTRGALCQSEEALLEYINNLPAISAEADYRELIGPSCQWLDNYRIFAVTKRSFTDHGNYQFTIGQLYPWPSKGEIIYQYGIINRLLLDSLQET